MLPHRFLTFTVAVLLTLLLWIQHAAAQNAALPFDPAEMTDAERRAVQGALAQTGDYIGLVDGKWGPMSDSALGDWASRQGHAIPPRLGDIGYLLQSFSQRLTDERWRVVYLDWVGYSVGIPNTVFSEPPSGPSGVMRAMDGSLEFLWTTTSPREASQLHRSALDRAASVPPPEHFDTPNLAVTSVALPDGGRIYVRTVPGVGGSLTFRIRSTAPRNDILRLMAATLIVGRAPDLTVPEDGVLAATMQTLPTPQFATRSRDPDPAPQPPLVSAPRNSGTAFFVNANTLVTSYHATARCQGIVLGDGTPARRIAADRQTDLALLVAPGTERSWLVVNRSVTTRLGQTVHALGHPHHEVDGAGVFHQRIDIMSLGDPVSPASRMTLSAALPPGNSGAPIVADDGSVLGVVKQWPPYAATAPQSTDAATPLERLVDFLDRSAVELPPRPRWTIDMNSGFQPDLVSAIVPIFCR